MKYPLYYLHGLNTYDDDCLHLGPVRLGKMYEKILNPIHWNGRAVTAVTPITPGPLSEQIDQTYSELLKLIEDESAKAIHLLGHSTGGLIARALAHRLARDKADTKLLSVTSIATPHAGSRLAEHVITSQLPKGIPQICKFIGYDIDRRKRPFTDLTPDAVKSFNSKFSNLGGITYQSIRCKAPQQRLSWPLKALRLSHGLGFEGDGIIDYDAQTWGTNLGDFELDHLQQIGWDVQLHPRKRAATNSEFLRMIECLNLAMETLDD